MAIGALIAALPAVWQGWLPGALSFRPLFAVVAVGSLSVLGFRAIMPHTRPAPASPSAAEAPAAAAAGRRAEHGMLMRLMGINALNGLAIGMVGPFMAYWFHLSFGVGAEAIGPVIALGFALSSVSSLWAGRLARRFGAARAVVVMRLIALVLFVLLPFAPTYGLAAACYVLRGTFNRGSAGPRQVVGLKLVGPGRRGLGASLNAISMQIPRAIGPLLGGVLLEAQLLALPMLIAAGLQAGYLALYDKNFRRVD
jgi:predicted MFS family arabinose efflux permease